MCLTEKYLIQLLNKGSSSPQWKSLDKENRLTTSPSSFTGKKATKDKRVSTIAALQASTSGHYSFLNRLKLVRRCSFTTSEIPPVKSEFSSLQAKKLIFCSSSFTFTSQNTHRKFFGFFDTKNYKSSSSSSSSDGRCLQNLFNLQKNPLLLLPRDSLDSALLGWLVGPLLCLPSSETSCGVRNESGSLSANNGR